MARKRGKTITRSKVGDHKTTTNPIRIVVDRVPGTCDICPFYMLVTHEDYEDTNTYYCLARSKLMLGQYGAVNVVSPNVYECPLLIERKQIRPDSSYSVRNKVIYVTILTIIRNFIKAVNKRFAKLNTAVHPITLVKESEVIEWPKVEDEDRVY